MNIKELIKISHDAGKKVLSIYNQSSFDIMNKKDNSALTKADIDSHTYICHQLTTLYPSIPIISEESAEEINHDIRKEWESFFLIDPLDGTKEFIQRNGEFTINIALIKNQQPLLAVIHAPALKVTFYAERNKGAYKLNNQECLKLQKIKNVKTPLRVAVSRSHCCDKTKHYLQMLKDQGKQIIETPAGSALKFGLIAEGSADIYPRFSPTMEWDTAAGHLLVNEVGKEALIVGEEKPLQYNKPHLVNPSFIVQ